MLLMEMGLVLDRFILRQGFFRVSFRAWSTRGFCGLRQEVHPVRVAFRCRQLVPESFRLVFIQHFLEWKRFSWKAPRA